MKIQGAYHNSLRHSKKLHDWMKVCENERIQKTLHAVTNTGKLRHISLRTAIGKLDQISLIVQAMDDPMKVIPTGHIEPAPTSPI
jgi:DNA transposition AAA+ family ATPase